ncbi:uncharacterized protein LOC132893679 [Neoarius graeffei]|uniref:uncharacterized protein LOC132893679 n=1 Tax=Neoarius graeffei TaxID=443677 RepID=UPI00298BD1CB|nr:uncharacterized protein LOC132893679 [Neoarius graeffei]
MEIYQKCSTCRAISIIKDPYHHIISLLPSGKRYRSISCRTSRMLNSFKLLKVMQVIQVQQDPRDLVLSKGSSMKVTCSITATGMQLIQVQQDKRDLVLSKRSSLKITCSITGTTNPYLYWYHWNETSGFTLVFTSTFTGSVTPASEGQFKSHRPDWLQIILESDGVSEIGSAVWYCAASPHSITVSSQSCTKTTSSSKAWVLCSNTQYAAHTGPTGPKGPGSVQRLIAEGHLLDNQHE